MDPPLETARVARRVTFADQHPPLQEMLDTLGWSNGRLVGPLAAGGRVLHTEVFDLDFCRNTPGDFLLRPAD